MHLGEPAAGSGGDGWTWRYEGWDPSEEPLREALCAVGNGYLVTRGAAPESPAGDVHHPGTYLAGVYNRLTSPVDGREVENESLVNGPNWLPLSFRPAGGRWFDMGGVEVLEHEQTLDLHRALLTRRSRVRDPQGHTTTLTQRRFVDVCSGHVCALETTILAEDWSGPVEICSALDGTVENTLVERYRALASRHLRPVTTGRLDPDGVLLEVETTQSEVRVAMAARTRVRRENRTDAVGRRLVEEPGWVGDHLELELAEGEPVIVEKLVTVFTSRDRAISTPGDAAVRLLGRLGGFDALLAHHSRGWARRWEHYEVGLDGDGDRLRVVRLHLLHLLQTVSRHSVDLDVGVPPRGLHGEAYRGHILWDELFVLPMLNLHEPLLSRAMLRYRHRRLPEACHAAAEAGHSGAMFPWQSASDGREESQTVHLNPMSGRWVPDPTRLQRHVSLAVAYNVWQYHQATGDLSFLTHYGAEMLAQIARFFAGLATYDHSRDRYVIRGVMGPDEFHTRYPGATSDGIDNNAYTNVMASWVLTRAREALESLSARARLALGDLLDLTDHELDRWDDVARKLYVPFHDDGVLSQFEGYDDLEELDWERYRRRYGNIQRLDRILESEGDSVDRYKASKQADVLMLFYLLSAEELRDALGHLGYDFDPSSIPRTIDYYLARTSHGSTLSAVVHAWVLVRAHREQAFGLFEEALRSDVADVQGGTTSEGIHLAAMAGTVDLLERCIAGLELRAGQLVLNPCCPEGLGSLEFGLRYQGHPLAVRLTGDALTLWAADGLRSPIEVLCRGERAVLAPGARLDFAL